MKKSTTEIKQMITAFENNYESLLGKKPEDDTVRDFFTTLLVKKVEHLFNSQWDDNSIETIKEGYDIWQRRHEGKLQPHEADGFGLVKSKPKKSKQTRKKTNKVFSKDNEASRVAKPNNRK